MFCQATHAPVFPDANTEIIIYIFIVEAKSINVCCRFSDAKTVKVSSQKDIYILNIVLRK